MRCAGLRQKPREREEERGHTRSNGWAALVGAPLILNSRWGGYSSIDPTDKSGGNKRDCSKCGNSSFTTHSSCNDLVRSAPPHGLEDGGRRILALFPTDRPTGSSTSITPPIYASGHLFLAWGPFTPGPIGLHSPHEGGFWRGAAGQVMFMAVSLSSAKIQKPMTS